VLKRCRFRHGAEAAVMSSAASCRLCWRSPDFTVSVRERPAPVHHDGRRGRQGAVKGSPSQARARSYPRSPHWQDGLDRSAPALRPAIRSHMRNRCRKFQPCRGWRSRLTPRTDRPNSASSDVVPSAVKLLHRTSETSTCVLDVCGISFRRPLIRRNTNGRDDGSLWNRLWQFVLLRRNPRPATCRNLPRSILAAYFLSERLR
jgi:hypothetical protein